MNKKKKNGFWALNDATNKIDTISEEILNTIFELDRTKFKLLDNLERFNNLNEILSDNVSMNEVNELIKISNYIPNEIVTFETNLFPINYYKLEEYSKFTQAKNKIVFIVSEKLKEINFSENKYINTWDRAIVIFEVSKNGRAADLDNYYFKPYVDAIVLSKLVKNDFASNLSLLYTDLDSSREMLRVTVINREFIAKYIGLIQKIL